VERQNAKLRATAAADAGCSMDVDEAGTSECVIMWRKFFST